MDAITHRNARRPLGWSEGADLAPSSEIPMRWYLRGSFTAAEAQSVCGEAEELTTGAVITGFLTEGEANTAAGRLGAAAMLRVL